MQPAAESAAALSCDCIAEELDALQQASRRENFHHDGGNREIFARQDVR
jgi:hypothetical protein